MFPSKLIRDQLVFILPSILVITIFVCTFVEFAPISSIWLIAYVSLVFTVSIWLMCIVIHYLLKSNSPLKYESLSFITENACLMNVLNNTLGVKKLKIILDGGRKSPKAETVPAEYDSATLSVISSAIERKFVSSWYSEAVSKEISFPFSCKELLDQVIARFIQVCKHIDAVELTSEAIVIFLRHYKEFKRAQKRKEKINKGLPQDYYKSVHPTSSNTGVEQKQCSTEDYCMLLVRTFLKELIPWELWGTPHSYLLSSIIAKKLNFDIHNTFTEPNWLKLSILSLVNQTSFKQEVIPEKNLTEKPFITEEKHTPPEKDEEMTIVNVSARKAVERPAVQTIHQPRSQNFHSHIEQQHLTDSSNSPKKSVAAALTTTISHGTASVLQRAEISPSHLCNESSENYDPLGVLQQSRPIDIQNGKKKTKGLREVKIYNRINEGNDKTWNNMDIDCVSPGHDLLESIDGEINLEPRLGRLWEADNTECSEGWSPNPPTNTVSNRSPHLWFGEDDLDIELSEESPPKMKLSNTKSNDLINFSIGNIHNIKDLQNISKTTVSQAKHKIGDLQDEAAGVMEGILDFGIAGIRKGLRMTGLQDTVQDASKVPVGKEKHLQQQSHPKQSGTPSPTRKNSQTELPTKILQGSKTQADNVQKVCNSYNQHLVKQHKVTSLDSAALDSNLKFGPSQSSASESIDLNPLPTSTLAALPILDTDSPEFEYEETADLAASIAKLRNLLHIKSCDATPNSSEDCVQDAMAKPSPFPGPATVSLINTSPSRLSRDRIARFDAVPLAIEADSIMDDQDDIPIHRAHIAWSGQNLPQAGNNMQRLDRLFTRTVTGVFNSIKTVVGADTQEGGEAYLPLVSLNHEFTNHGADHHLHTMQQSSLTDMKNDWYFTDGEFDISTLVGRLLAERRGFCIVEAAQDSLEALDSPKESMASPALSPLATGDDLDESDIFSNCPLWQGLLEIYATAVGGRHVPLKCASILAADMTETVLESLLNKLTAWLKDTIFDYFRHANESLHNAKKRANVNIAPMDSNSQETDTSADAIANTVMDNIPGIVILLLGDQETRDALRSIVSSIESASANRDVVFQLLDLATVHFLKATSLRHGRYMPTPPPSA